MTQPHPIPTGSARRLQYRLRRSLAVLVALAGVIAVIFTNSSGLSPSSNGQAAESSAENSVENPGTNTAESTSGSAETSKGSAADSADPAAPLASAVLALLEVKGRAPKTGYARTEFYSSWPDIEGCSLRQRIIRRELGDSAVLADECTVVSGEFTEPYTGAHLVFTAKTELSSGLQIDHVVALSDAWQKGAQNLSADQRYALATDPLNLLAVDSAANQQKSDGDAATWLPKNKAFRCQYVARQVSVKYKYHLWVTEAEKAAISGVLESCPAEPAVGVAL